MKSIELELLQYSYWEHYKFAKDLSFVLPLKHPKRVKIEREINKIQQQILLIHNPNTKP